MKICPLRFTGQKDTSFGKQCPCVSTKPLETRPALEVGDNYYHAQYCSIHLYDRGEGSTISAVLVNETGVHSCIFSLLSSTKERVVHSCWIMRSWHFYKKQRWKGRKSKIGPTGDVCLMSSSILFEI